MKRSVRTVSHSPRTLTVAYKVIHLLLLGPGGGGGGGWDGFSVVVFLMRSEHEGQIVCPRLASVEAATLFGRPFAHYGAIEQE